MFRRTVCRRAERAVVRLAESEGGDPALVAYLNRLSDLLFVLARRENHRAGAGDVLWTKGS
jgi:cob(I)alamin adenosyltransferase